jgi:glycosyltransferase involved in cell wall biosynthesis
MAYVEHFGDRAQAVVQRRGWYVTLSARQSRVLFTLLLSGERDIRRRFVSFVLGGALFGLRRQPVREAIYLNVGHTGLDEGSLPGWIARHRLRAIYLVHDLIPLTHPQYCRASEDDKHEQRMRTVLESATGVIGNSQATLDDLRALSERLGLPMPPAVVAWLSGQALPRPRSAPPVVHPYFLVLGTIEGRKNHRLLLDVWRRLLKRFGEEAPRLVIVGARGWKADDVFAQLDALGPLANLIEERSGCSDEQLAELMAGARALLMPSFAEGYGMPVFEALEFGTPVIAADLPVYHEVAGDIPMYLDPHDVPAWEGAIVSYGKSDTERNDQLRRTRDFKVPNWSSHFAAIDRWLVRLID